MNKLDPIKFAVEWSDTSINFLNMLIMLSECIIETDLCVNPTYCNQNLEASSY